MGPKEVDHIPATIESLDSAIGKCLRVIEGMERKVIVRSALLCRGTFFEKATLHFGGSISRQDSTEVQVLRKELLVIRGRVVQQTHFLHHLLNISKVMSCVHESYRESFARASSYKRVSSFS